MFDYELFRKIIKNGRKELNMTTEKFAELADISEKNLNKIETGHHKPNLETILSIFNALKLPLPSDENYDLLKETATNKFNNLDTEKQEYILSAMQLMTKYKVEKRIN